MKKILVFGASNSKNSINKALAFYAASKLENVTLNKLDLNDFEMPLYSIDKETENGIPEQAYLFKQHIKNADAILISFAEHNGNVTAAFKNLYDWSSRIKEAMWQDKTMFLLSTSPGKRGGTSSLGVVMNHFPHMNGNIVASFSLPSFYDNFSAEDGILNEELKQEFEKQLEIFVKAL